MLFMGKSTISMAIFNGYVSLPEGKYFISMTGHFDPGSHFFPSLGLVSFWLAVQWQGPHVHSPQTHV